MRSSSSAPRPITDRSSNPTGADPVLACPGFGLHDVARRHDDHRLSACADLEVHVYAARVARTEDDICLMKRLEPGEFDRQIERRWKEAGEGEGTMRRPTQPHARPSCRSLST